MKFLFWILAILSLPIALFMSFSSYMIHGLDLAGTIFGEVVAIAGMLSLLVSIACLVLGIIMLRKGNAKKAVAFALAGLIYSAIIFAGIYIDDAAHTILLNKSIAEQNEQLYGENWDAPPAIDGIPELYQEILNKFYVAVRDEWTADRLTGLAAAPMTNYYDDAPLDNIGFALMDVNGDGTDELLIGTTTPVENGGTGIFCLYCKPENPSTTLDCVENEIYYLHSNGASGTYTAEIGGEDRAWRLDSLEGSTMVDITHLEGAMDPASRLTLELIPFSQYK